MNSWNSFGSRHDAMSNHLKESYKPCFRWRLEIEGCIRPDVEFSPFGLGTAIFVARTHAPIKSLARCERFRLVLRNRQVSLLVCFRTFLSILPHQHLIFRRTICICPVQFDRAFFAFGIVLGFEQCGLRRFARANRRGK